MRDTYKIARAALDAVRDNPSGYDSELIAAIERAIKPLLPGTLSNLPIHRTEAQYGPCSTCDGCGCYDCTDPA